MCALKLMQGWQYLVTIMRVCWHLYQWNAWSTFVATECLQIVTVWTRMVWMSRCYIVPPSVRCRQLTVYWVWLVVVRLILHRLHLHLTWDEITRIEARITLEKSILPSSTIWVIIFHEILRKGRSLPQDSRFQYQP